MRQNWKRLARVLACVLLAGLLLTGCSLPLDGVEEEALPAYTVDAENRTAEAEDGSWTIRVLEDGEGGRLLVCQNHQGLVEKDCAVAADLVIRDEEDEIVYVTRLLAVRRSALGEDAGEDELGYVVLLFTYDLDGKLIVAGAKYGDASIECESLSGWLVQYDGKGDMSAVWNGILGQQVSDRQVRSFLIELSRSAWDAAQRMTAIVQAEFGSSAGDGGVVGSGSCADPLEVLPTLKY